MATAGAGPGRSQEPGSPFRSPVWVQGLMWLALLCCFPMCVSRSWIGSRAPGLTCWAPRLAAAYGSTFMDHLSSAWGSPKAIGNSGCGKRFPPRSLPYSNLGCCSFAVRPRLCDFRRAIISFELPLVAYARSSFPPDLQLSHLRVLGAEYKAGKTALPPVFEEQPSGSISNDSFDSWF